jgi:hypothetical protein
MASTIVTKNSSTAAAAPTAGQLTQGELAVNVTDKKLYTKDSGGSVVKIVGGLGNQEANAVAITGGTVNGTSVGATTASTGAFTNLKLNGSTSGYVGLQAAATAGSTTYVLPSADGTNGQVLATNGTGTLSWATASGGGGGGFSGATVTSSATDITLTNSSTQTQTISMTASGKFVNLPDATTLSTKGGPVFIIQNKGQNQFGVKDASGKVVTPMLTYGQSVSLVLLSNSTSAGSWGTQVSGTAGLAGMGPVNASSISIAYGGYVTVCGLSSTQALIAYPAAAARIDVVLATISGSTVTYGTPVTLASSVAATTVYATTPLSSSLAVFATPNNGGVTQLIAVSVSGSTVTVGTAASLGFTVTACSAFQESATAGALSYTDGSTTVARGFTVSGTTITIGTAQTLGSAAVVNTAKLATGSYVSTYYENSTPAAYARPWTSSSGTVTLGTQTTYAGTTQQYFFMSQLGSVSSGFGASSTCGFFAQSVYNITVNISGSAISSLICQYSYISPFTGYNPGPFAAVSPFGSNAVLTTTTVGYITAHTASANGFGGSVGIGTLGLGYTNNLANYSYCDATTNIFAGNYNGLIGAVVIKGN